MIATDEVVTYIILNQSRKLVPLPETKLWGRLTDGEMLIATLEINNALKRKVKKAFISYVACSKFVTNMQEYFSRVFSMTLLSTLSAIVKVNTAAVV